MRGARLSRWQSADDIVCVAGLLQSGDNAGAPPKAKKWSMSRPYWATVTAIESLCTITHPDDRDTVRVEIDLGDSGLRYSPGDALGVHPLNSSQVSSRG